MTERPDTDPGVRGDRDATTLEPDPTAPRAGAATQADDPAPDQGRLGRGDAPDAPRDDR